jgi:hypothetical protein
MDNVGAVPASSALPVMADCAVETPGSVTVTVTSDEAPAASPDTTTVDPRSVTVAPPVAVKVYTSPAWKLAIPKVNPSAVPVGPVRIGAHPTARAEPVATADASV